MLRLTATASALLLATQALASSSYEIRTNQELRAVLEAALKVAGNGSAIESVRHVLAETENDYNRWIVQTSGQQNCTYYYEAIYGGSEAEGLKRVQQVPEDTICLP
jgi:hypothetical protein